MSGTFFQDSKSAYIASQTTVVAVVTALIYVIVALTVAYLLSRVLKEHQYRTNLTFNMISSALAALSLYFRYGTGVEVWQGLTLYFLLLYASWSDLTNHEVSDWVWIALVPVGLLSITTVGPLSMICGAIAVFLPQLGLAVIPPNKTLGGADIKISTALAFVLGITRGLLAFSVGLVTAVIFITVYNKIKQRNSKEPFALIPFLAGAAYLAFLI